MTVMTHRPREVERKSDGIGEARKSNVGTQINDVLTEHRCDDVTVSARCRRVDFNLVLLEAHPESSLADARAVARAQCNARATTPEIVLAVLVHERL